jgi:hypothetical protein
MFWPHLVWRRRETRSDWRLRGRRGREVFGVGYCAGVRNRRVKLDRPHRQARAHHRSSRRECLDHVVVANEAGLRRVLREPHLLPAHTHACRAGQGPAGLAVHCAAVGRTGGRGATGRRPVSPLRSRRRIVGRSRSAPPTRRWPSRIRVKPSFFGPARSFPRSSVGGASGKA